MAAGKYFKWNDERESLLAAARVAMPEGAYASEIAVIEWALRTAPLATKKAREIAAAPLDAETVRRALESATPEERAELVRALGEGLGFVVRVER